MDKYLLVDFGSTYTKLTAVDLDKCEIMGTAKDITTINEGITIGYEKALKKLEEKINKQDYKKILACSSAAGGLKMISIGLGKALTVEAAKRAALGAGARILKTYSYELTEDNLNEIENLDCDIILLSGGTNHGNSRNIIYNARQLAKKKLNIPIVIAGNEAVKDEISEIFEEAQMEYFITENVMPQVNVLNANPAREKIRSIFMDRIVYAKGIDKIEGQINGVLMPTPAAVLKGAELLSKGTENVEGIGDLIVIDIGGATTDVHSIGKGSVRDQETRFEGLQEPFAKRTVEGDLGMRYSALSLFEAVGEEKLKLYLKNGDYDIYNSCKYRSENIKMVPTSDEDYIFDEAMAMAATEVSIKRHCGKFRKEFSYSRYIYYQSGKDLRDIKNIIGTGGVIVHSKNPVNILKSVENNEDPMLLTPESPSYFIDKEYILSAMGLLGTQRPDESIIIMKKYLKKLEL